MLNFVPTGSRQSRTRRNSSIRTFGEGDWPIFSGEGLRGLGIDTKEPIPEDWGWLGPVINPPFRLWIGCGHYQEYEDGFLCFIEPHRPFVWRLFRRIDTRERIAALQRATDNILVEDAGIRAKRWGTYQEFNNPSLETAEQRPNS